MGHARGMEERTPLQGSEFGGATMILGMRGALSNAISVHSVWQKFGRKSPCSADK